MYGKDNIISQVLEEPLVESHYNELWMEHHGEFIDKLYVISVIILMIITIIELIKNKKELKTIGSNLLVTIFLILEEFITIICIEIFLVNFHWNIKFSIFLYIVLGIITPIGIKLLFMIKNFKLRRRGETKCQE